jgi:superfamily II DNA or RNA helicase
MIRSIPFVIDNDQHRLSDVLNALLGESVGRPVDVATAYFSISGYRLVKDGLHKVGAFRLLLGAEPRGGGDIGLRADERGALLARLRGELEASPFNPETLRLIEELIAFLRADKVEVRLYERGFLHAKAYLFHQDVVGASHRGDRLRPYVAIVGSSNFTGPGLTSNRELNIVHRVFTEADEATDRDAAERVAYLSDDAAAARPIASDAELPATARRLIKSEVGARAIFDLTVWFERQWREAADFKEDLIELLDASKFGRVEYTPYQVYLKALYEYFRDELGDEALQLGRSAVALAEFQEDAVKRARRILARYDGVLIADSVGLGKTWIGKKLLEDFAYHRRQKAIVVCAASLREMWTKELASATIAAQVLGMEVMGRETFDPKPWGDADVILVDESHNFRNGNANRYLRLEEVIQLNGGRGRDGARKKIILLSATPINNDLYDLLNQISLFTQAGADYFRDIGIGDLNLYFRQARQLMRQPDASPGTVLFNLLEEIVVRNTRPFIREAYPNATISGKPVRFPDRKLRTIRYSLGATYAGLYGEIVQAIDQLSLAPYKLESYRRPETVLDKQDHEWKQGREQGFVGIFKIRFLKRLESSVEAFRLSLHRALTFESTYLEYLLDGKVVASRDFQRATRYLERETEDEADPGSVADELDAVAEAKAYINSLTRVDLNEYDLRRLRHDVETDVKLLKGLYDRTSPLAANDVKLGALKELLAGELRGKKVLVFSSFKDTARYVHDSLTSEGNGDWLSGIGRPLIRRIDSGNHPNERGHILGLFAPVANQADVKPDDQIDILISTDVLSEGQNLQDCGVIVNYDLTWNPIRLVQRGGRIDRIGSPHETVVIHNMFPEEELERLLRLVERLSDRISQIDELGFLDGSVLGEVVHPRTFNTIRRIRDEDDTVLDDEEARAELAGPETLLKQLRELLNRQGQDALVALPHGIHSGLRRKGCYGMFFYFQAPRPGESGKRHFWRYIDARTHEVLDNRFLIAQVIACQPDEPRFIGDQDVFLLQEKVIDHILRAERETDARAAAPRSMDRTPQAVAEELKNALRRGTVDREATKAAIRYLGQPMGRFAAKRLKAVYAEWTQQHDDATLLDAVGSLAADFGKHTPDTEPRAATPRREDLELICFEYVS